MILLIGGGNNLEMFLLFVGSIVLLVHKGNNFEIVFPFCFDFVDVKGFDG